MRRASLLLAAVLMNTALPVSAANGCPDFLDHDLRRLHSSESVNICSDYKNRPLLIVNTASHCGYTPQFQGLEALHREYGPKGLVVIGVPSDDFRQEADNEAETAKVCYLNYGVTFTMTVPVKGEAAHPIFSHLAEASRAPEWNFNKYLVSRDGRVIGHFGSRVEPQSPELTRLIEEIL